MKTSQLLSGIFFLFLGLYLFNNPFAAVGTIAWVVAFFIFLSGANGLQLYLAMPKELRSIHLILQSLISMFLGFSLMASSAMSRSNLVMIFVSTWMMVLGLIRFIWKKQSYPVTQGKNSGLVMFGIGLLLFIAPVFSSVFIGKFFSIIFIMMGVSALLFAFRNH